MNGDLNTEIVRNEVWRQARSLVLEGLASEGELARVVHALHCDGYGQVRARLERRRETLELIEPIISDFFAFDAAARL
jgi:hypothetical protein